MFIGALLKRINGITKIIPNVAIPNSAVGTY